MKVTACSGVQYGFAQWQGHTQDIPKGKYKSERSSIAIMHHPRDTGECDSAPHTPEIQAPTPSKVSILLNIYYLLTIFKL